MRVFVTGGAGYIGSHVVRHLVRAGHDVLIFDDLSSGHREAVSSVPLEVGDIGDVEHLKRILSEYHPDAVMHFAGLIRPGDSMRDPAGYYRTNAVAGLGLLTVMRDLGVKRIVFSSTAAVYGIPNEIPIRENHPTVPINPYGSSKLTFEFMLSDFSRAYGLGFIALRYFNAAGADPAGDIGEDHPDECHLIPLILRSTMGVGPALRVFGNDYDTPDGTCIRDYVHVTDLAEAHVLTLPAISEGRGMVYNVGTGQGHSVGEIIKAAGKVVGHPIPFETASRRPGDPPRLVAATDKIQTELGWKPMLSDLDGILRTAWQWHQSHPGGYAES